MEVPTGWSIQEDHLMREFSFDNFADAKTFVDEISVICEEQNHHADFELGWGRAKAMIWTHKINGLSESDFFLAAKFDEI